MNFLCREKMLEKVFRGLINENEKNEDEGEHRNTTYKVLRFVEFLIYFNFILFQYYRNVFFEWCYKVIVYSK